MRKPVIAVLVGTLLALVGASTWVPTVISGSAGRAPMGLHTLHWQWVTTTVNWDRLTQPSAPRLRVVWDHVHWPVLIAEFALILLLGGGLLTWVVRRERRRKAAA